MKGPTAFPRTHKLFYNGCDLTNCRLKRERGKKEELNRVHKIKEEEKMNKKLPPSPLQVMRCIQLQIVASNVTCALCVCVRLTLAWPVLRVNSVTVECIFHVRISYVYG